jgi:deoxyribodipyrimidine photo-lyase
MVYVMSRDQRVQDNHALLAAQDAALEAKLPLVVVFNLLRKTGVRAREHYEFMVAGLKQVEQDLLSKSISFAVTMGDPKVELLTKFDELKPAEVYFDFNPLGGPRNVQKLVAANVNFPVFVVDTHNIIPLWVLSPKQEFAAHTMRSKVHKNLAAWLVEPGELINHPYSFNEPPKGSSWAGVDDAVSEIKPNGSSVTFQSGEKAGLRVLEDLVDNKLERYALDRNDMTKDGSSNLSPYLHYGQISSLRVALEVIKAMPEPPLLLTEVKLAQSGDIPSKQDGGNALLEELIVRKELADNYCFYTKDYDNLNGAWPWAKLTLSEHENDVREHLYTQDELAQSKTHDPYWNAAQNQMRTTGKMHGYMRMYWAKKILEWSPSVEQAIKTCIHLNDFYSLDGGDPNGYTGIMWSIAGVHDRLWFDRLVFGKIRYMNEGGLMRKFDVKGYVETWV